MLTYKTIRGRFAVLSVLPVLFVLFACAKAPERSALALAAEHGDLSKVQQQVNEGADISAKDDKGLDALSYAIINERRQVAEYLLTRGANANTENDSGITALIIAATVGDLAIVESLHQHGAEINRGTKDGITPLMAAVASDNQETAELLLSYGADPCMRDKNHLTARQTADQWRGSEETSRVISRNKKLARLNCNRSE
ncbi:ankyrin repeat domain-containing protein [Paraburkholderia dilworthii]|uniref:ankyrin repeat domain-containing protein n=1 Tax=Paraburkholderia dilworthii TaxID=948106 RepID=UPI00047FEAE1|nr:ankyrin repeat domain-containing protein [Paraburkholderia dilworthii]